MMLVIRAKQMQIFETRALATFERCMAVHLRDFSPPLMATLDEDAILKFVRYGIKRSGMDGFTLQGPVQLYLETMLLLGSGFSGDPQYPWVKTALRSQEKRDGGELDRATRLYEHLLEYRALVDGPEDMYALEALRELERYAARPVSYRRDNLEDRLLADMAAIYPQKVRCVGERAVRDLLQAGMSTAVTIGLDGQVRSVVLVCILMFSFGHECVHDPLYPWIEHTLADPLITDQESRARRLEAKAINWLRHVNEYFRRGR